MCTYFCVKSQKNVHYYIEVVAAVSFLGCIDVDVEIVVVVDLLKAIHISALLCLRSEG